MVDLIRNLRGGLGLSAVGIAHFRAAPLLHNSWKPICCVSGFWPVSNPPPKKKENTNSYIFPARGGFHVAKSLVPYRIGNIPTSKRAQKYKKNISFSILDEFLPFFECCCVFSYPVGGQIFPKPLGGPQYLVLIDKIMMIMSLCNATLGLALRQPKLTVHILDVLYFSCPEAPRLQQTIKAPGLDL